MAGGRMTFEQKVDTILADIKTLLLAKHEHYGEHNLDKHGTTGITIRMSDKMARLENAMMGKYSAVHESTQDTLQDLIGYAVQYLIRLEAAE